MNEFVHPDSAILRRFRRFRAARTYQTPTLTAIFPGVPLHRETPAWGRGGKRALDVARSVVARAPFGPAWPLTALAIRADEAPHFHIVSKDDMSVIDSRTERPPFTTRAMRVVVTGEGAR